MLTCDVPLLCCRASVGRHLRPWSAGSSAAARSPRTTSIAEHYKTFTAALRAIETNYVDKVSPIGWCTAPSAACSARSIRIRASSIRKRVRADARAAGRPLLRPRDHDCRDRRRHRRTERVRRIAGLQDGHAARRHHRANRRRGREGLDHRTGDASSCAGRRAPTSISRSSGAATSRRFRSKSPATRSTSRRCRRYFMVDATTGYIQHAGLRREHRPRGQGARCAISPSRA